MEASQKALEPFYPERMASRILGECHAVPCRAMSCCAVLCCAVLCCAVLCCAVRGGLRMLCVSQLAVTTYLHVSLRA